MSVVHVRPDEQLAMAVHAPLVRVAVAPAETLFELSTVQTRMPYDVLGVRPESVMPFVELEENPVEQLEGAVPTDLTTRYSFTPEPVFTSVAAVQLSVIVVAVLLGEPMPEGLFGAVVSLQALVPFPVYPLAQVAQVWFVEFVQVTPEPQLAMAVQGRVDSVAEAPAETFPALSTVQTRTP